MTGDLHRLMGLWSVWFVALIALTGLWYLVETLGGNAKVPKLPEVTVTAVPTGVALDRLVDVARRADPALDIQEIRFTPDSGIIFLGQSSAWLVRDRANAVVIDPATSRVVGQLDGRALNVHQRISEMADPLHFGTFGGLWTKVIWFLFGALLTAMAITGTMIYAMRLARSSRSEAGGMKHAWQGMGNWGYVGVALILLALILTPGAIGGAS